jgi:hypothetical protein
MKVRLHYIPSLLVRGSRDEHREVIYMLTR